MTAAEVREFEQWVEANPERVLLLREVRWIWDHTPRHQFPDQHEDALWSALQERLEQEDRQPGRKTIYFSPLLKVAAAVLLLLSVSIALYQGIGPAPQMADALTDLKPIPAPTPAPTTPSADIAMTTVEADATVRLVYLPDSTRVWLNQHSQLQYPSAFSHRHVSLKGEAYFDVTPDASHPFIIETPLTLTTVVGTAFNFRQQATGDLVTVDEGVVKMKSKTAADSILIKKSEAGQFEQGKLFKQTVRKSASPWRKVNNPSYEQEMLHPENFLQERDVWHKNTVNLSVIEGTLYNAALLTTYRNPELRATYTKANGKQVTVSFTVDAQIAPGQTLTFRKRLTDIFSNTQRIQVQVTRAQVAR